MGNECSQSYRFTGSNVFNNTQLVLMMFIEYFIVIIQQHATNHLLANF